MTTEDKKTEESRDTAKNESDAAKAVETSDTGTSAVATTRTTTSTTHLVTAKSYERCTVTKSATGKSTQSTKVNTMSSVRTEKADEDSSDEEPPAKRNKSEKPLKTTSMIATTIVTDDSSTEILYQKTTHDLRDTAAVRKVTDDLLAPLLDTIGARKKSFVDIKLNPFPNENPEKSPQLTLALNLQVKSNTNAANQQKPKEKSVHTPKPGQTFMAGTILHLEEILEKQKAKLPNIALSVTVKVEEAPFTGLSAAEKDKRTEDRREAKADLLMHFASHDNLCPKKLIPLYRKFLYAANEEESLQELPQVSTSDDYDAILATELSDEDEEEEEDEGDVDWKEDEEEAVLEEEDGELEDEDEVEEEDNLEDEDYEEDEDAEMDEDDD